MYPSRLIWKAEYLDEILTKVFKNFPPCYSQSPLQFWLEISIASNYATSDSFLHSEISISSNSRNLLQFLQLKYSVREKGGIPNRKPYPLTYGLRNPYRNLKSKNSQDYAQNPQQHCIRSWIRLWHSLQREVRLPFSLIVKHGPHLLPSKI